LTRETRASEVEKTRITQRLLLEGKENGIKKFKVFEAIVDDIVELESLQVNKTCGRSEGGRV
jgi:hypothetical protein